MTTETEELKAMYAGVKAKIETKQKELQDLEEKIELIRLKFSLLKEITIDHIKEADRLVAEGHFKTRTEAIASMYDISPQKRIVIINLLKEVVDKNENNNNPSDYSSST